MAKEKYWVLDPDGSACQIEIERINMLDEFYAAIDCDCLENVRTIIPDVCLIVDESGRIKYPAKQHNARASLLYLGYLVGRDDIVGSAILAAIHLVDGESDWVPLSPSELAKVTACIGGLRSSAGSQ